MKYFIFSLFFLYALEANKSTVDLDAIEVSIQESSESFKEQKLENNIAKLLKISQVLYDNNKKLKELKRNTKPKITLELSSEDKDLNSLEVDDIVEVKIVTNHSSADKNKKLKLFFEIFNKDGLLAEKSIDIDASSEINKEFIKFKIKEANSKYKVCVTFLDEDKICKSFSASVMLVVKDMIVSTSKKATKSDIRYSAKKDLYIFLPFQNNTNKNLNGTILILDYDTKKVILKRSFVKKPKKKKQKAGLKLPKSMLKENQRLSITLSLKGDGLKEVTKKKRIRISGKKTVVKKKEYNHKIITETINYKYTRMVLKYKRGGSTINKIQNNVVYGLIRNGFGREYKHYSFMLKNELVSVSIYRKENNFLSSQLVFKDGYLSRQTLYTESKKDLYKSRTVKLDKKGNISGFIDFNHKRPAKKYYQSELDDEQRYSIVKQSSQKIIVSKKSREGRIYKKWVFLIASKGSTKMPSENVYDIHPFLDHQISMMQIVHRYLIQSIEIHSKGIHHENNFFLQDRFSFEKGYLREIQNYSSNSTLIYEIKCDKKTCKPAKYF
ncbi:MAG: hypothetical protein JKY28_00075 [Sulfurimonas sp.]|nr:hypothetical protein [Sulfurimonas sp.]PHQ92809.1 MAG: hypothetical protein COB42_00275 [Sulfurimonas sp.]